MKKRKLKISTRHASRKYTSVDVPLIRLSGNWLENSGFNIGDYVEVTKQGNQLVITPVTGKSDA